MNPQCARPGCKRRLTHHQAQRQANRFCSRSCGQRARFGRTTPARAIRIAENDAWEASAPQMDYSDAARAADIKILMMEEIGRGRPELPPVIKAGDLMRAASAASVMLGPRRTMLFGQWERARFLGTEMIGERGAA